MSSVFIDMFLKRLTTWRYLGYEKETLKNYEEQIAKDNLRVFSFALPVAAVITVVELIFTCLFAISGKGVTHSLFITMNMLVVTAVAIFAISIVYLAIRNRPNAIHHSRILTTTLLAFWSVLYIVLGTCINPEDYAVTACGLFLLIQVMFNAYPMDNLIFVSCAYLLFAFLSFVNKSTMVFLYDMLDALPFLLVGLFLSWTKSRSKWASFINADAMVKLKTQKLENELLHSQIAVMLSQIQPHFLYNSLGVIRALCRKDPELAEKATIEFSDFLRGNIDSLKSEKPVLFAQELEHTKNYLSLEKLRFADRLNVIYDLEATLFSMPTLTLQPIVENAVRYGVSKRERGGTVTIATREYANRIEIIVTDDGVGFDPYEKKQDGRTHIGIDNVRNRLSQMCGGTLEVQSTAGVGTVSTITLPKKGNEYECNCIR